MSSGAVRIAINDELRPICIETKKDKNEREKLLGIGLHFEWRCKSEFSNRKNALSAILTNFLVYTSYTLS